jgi:putative lipoic acid-binding regulatory protein
MQPLGPAHSSNSLDRPVIEYPCNWIYKVVGEDRTLLRDVIIKACLPHAVTISYSQSSSKGKYHSINAELVIPDETARLRIYEILKSHSAVKIVL